MILQGNVHKYSDNVDTDVIIPARYLNSSNPADLALHCMEDIDAAFVANVRKGDIIVARQNFGCGSSREHAPLAIQASGVSLVIACSFARIFYRNALNIGLPILECPQADEIKAGDELRVNLDTGLIENLTQNTRYQAEAFPPFLQNIIAQGGLMNTIAASAK
ncbi:MAG: 3-isopropylmalate dehydratase small subunit [Oscillospiraceae bacterium]|jgi:3-isopropylmalate/(R)-2-methylmalate dehydratase small subunit|nr:3-isopropylmalate dehydratase small subunit [Oscillospiraceae bacterium]